MDHRQHSTGKGWMMMCNRVIVGMVIFQVTTAGQLALQRAFNRAALITPVLLGTLWFGYVYNRTYSPLMRYIALRSLREHSEYGRAVQEEQPVGRQTLDEARESGLRFINPALVMP